MGPSSFAVARTSVVIGLDPFLAFLVNPFQAPWLAFAYLPCRPCPSRDPIHPCPPFEVACQQEVNLLVTPQLVQAMLHL